MQTTHQNSEVPSNENWIACPKCGAPVFVNPETGAAEKCTNCDPKAVRLALAAGGPLLLMGLIAVVVLLAFAIWLLF